MPYVTDGEKGPTWVSKKGRDVRPRKRHGIRRARIRAGRIHRSDRMAETGLYSDGKKGIRRLTDPDLRLKDQDLDGVQAEVLYGILGTSQRLERPGSGDRGDAHLQRMARRILQDPPGALRGYGLDPQPRHGRGRSRKWSASPSAAGAGASKSRRTHDMKALYDPPLVSAVGRGRGSRPAGAFPHHRRQAAGLRIHGADAGAPGLRGTHHRLPDGDVAGR